VIRSREPASPLATDDRRVINLAALFGAFFGARLPYLVLGVNDLCLSTVAFGSGKTILGGLVGGYLAVEVAKWARGVRVKTGDSFVVPVAAGIAVGRIGCVVAGCCFGAPTALPWGMDFGDGVRRHPTQVYELAFHANAAVVLARFRAAGRYPRQLMKIYILAYLAFRFATEFVRPEPVVCAGLTGYQIACLALAPVFAALWRMDVRATA